MNSSGPVSGSVVGASVTLFTGSASQNRTSDRLPRRRRPTLPHFRTESALSSRLVLVVFALLWFSFAAQPAPTIVPIGAVQGAVLDTDVGNRHVSPMRDQTVTVRGVITELNLQRT